MILKEGKAWISRQKREGKGWKMVVKIDWCDTCDSKKSKILVEGACAYTRVRNSSTLLDGRLVTRGRISGDEEKIGLYGKGRSIGKREESLEEESLGEESLGKKSLG